ncbi:universal stress protein [uncultured Oxalicibacterium sp.]|uniref:universal stress protein n=1 Tax=uncultured Oxalicibacterium sp. TaxID=1168540 RepID=UPI0025EF6CE2|nr:universal stress protein [uncultured Oxalicibacterium sp.]
MIPVDGSKTALHALDHVVRQRALHPEELHITLLNVQPRLPRHITRFATASAVRQLQEERATMAMKEAVDKLAASNISYDVRVHKGDAAEQIAQHAAAANVERIVMGATKKNALLRFFQGSIVSKVMERTDVPVEVIASGKASRMERFGIPVGIGLTFLWLAVE